MCTFCIWPTANSGTYIIVVIHIIFTTQLPYPSLIPSPPCYLLYFQLYFCFIYLLSAGINKVFRINKSISQWVSMCVCVRACVQLLYGLVTCPEFIPIPIWEFLIGSTKPCHTISVLNGYDNGWMDIFTICKLQTCPKHLHYVQWQWSWL